MNARWWRLRHELERRREKLAFAIAWRLPRWLVYLAGIRLWASATMGEFSNETPVGMPMDTVLGRWQRRQGGDRSLQ